MFTYALYSLATYVELGYYPVTITGADVTGVGDIIVHSKTVQNEKCPQRAQKQQQQRFSSQQKLMCYNKDFARVSDSCNNKDECVHMFLGDIVVYYYRLH